jgi:hypothetical protein
MAKLPLDGTLQPIVYFKEPDYDITMLDTYLKQFIFNPYKDQNSTTSNKLLSLKTLPFTEYFSLQCLLSPRFTDHFCQRSFDKILSIAPLYDLSQNYDELTKIIKSIQ